MGREHPIWPNTGLPPPRPNFTPLRARPLVNLFSRARAHCLAGMRGPLDSFTPLPRASDLLAYATEFWDPHVRVGVVNSSSELRADGGRTERDFTAAGGSGGCCARWRHLRINPRIPLPDRVCALALFHLFERRRGPRRGAVAAAHVLRR